MHRGTRRFVAIPRTGLNVFTGIVLVVGACRPAGTARETLVTAFDYAFRVPDSLPPGQTILRFHNGGQVLHEMVVGLLRKGVTLTRVLEVLKAGGSPDSLLEGTVGILVARPGTTALAGLTVDLLPGRTYGFVCNLQDGPDKPRHAALGMFARREVRSSK